jgi:hypothetical protein
MVTDRPTILESWSGKKHGLFKSWFSARGARAVRARCAQRVPPPCWHVAKTPKPRAKTETGELGRAPGRGPGPRQMRIASFTYETMIDVDVHVDRTVFRCSKTRDLWQLVNRAVFHQIKQIPRKSKSGNLRDAANVRQAQARPQLYNVIINDTTQ